MYNAFEDYGLVILKQLLTHTVIIQNPDTVDNLLKIYKCQRVSGVFQGIIANLDSN